ncbi:MAG: TonB-dependent receptor [Chitinophagaceae bacterium]|nr:TonB-dependent receptor [Chitinophagaceae bacterium]MBK9463294.1 TonB-dependent receptor [Chitinophagaceae bacterium]HQW44522.1 TonB-dependent receptor [Chitinophagaceae bacterium]
MKYSLFTLPLVLLSLISFSQPPAGGGNRQNNGQMPTGRFYGKVVESKSGKPIEFASIQLIQNKMDTVTKKRKETVIAGMITKAHGEFSLENIPVMGQSKLKITIIGYKTFEQPVSFDIKMGGDMSAMMGALDKDLGNVKIEIEEKMLDNVTVTAESNPGLRLGIDRKVFNVDKNIVSAGGTAVDVMKNVPSVSVDLDGNVTMRNNSPQIFVDGRPTTMSLDQIPADVIESVEIITNPSAKFDASGGTSGIINVVLKKNKKVGYNGSIRTNIDSRGRIGLGTDINVRQEKINFFVSGNFNQRKSISTGNTDRLTYGSPNSQLFQNDRSIMKGNFGFGRAGFDYFIDNRNTISLSGSMAKGSFKPTNYSNLETDLLSTPVVFSLAERLSTSTSKFQNTGSMLSYKRNFPKAGHELTADVTYNKSKNNSSNLIKTDSLDYSTKNIVKTSSQRQDGSGTNENFIFQTDYTNPLTDKSKFEMGARVSIRKVDNKNDFFLISPSGTAIYNPLSSVNYNSTDKVYAAYSTYTNQIKNFGYQLGLRIESSNYEGRLPDKGQVFNIKFPVSLFPSIFLSNKMKNDQELQLNYTRKINRPNFFQLYPFTDYADSLNINRGNPNLNPEFTNSIELSYQKTFKKNKDNLLASVYYKNTTDLITRFQVQETSTITGKDILVNTYINASSSYVTGFELTLKTKMTKWWDLTTNMNLFTSKINTGIAGQPEQEQFASWFGKLNNTFKLFKNFTMQLSGEYQSKSILPPGGSGSGRGGGMFGGGMFGQSTSSQGYVRANYFVDAGFRYEFMKNKQASVSLNINDIFRTRRSDIHSESPFFTQDVFRRRDPQVARLSFNWRFGKFDPSLFKRKNNKNQGTDGMDGVNMGQ